MRNLAGGERENAASIPASSGAEERGEAADAAKQENTPREVGAALNTGERPVPLDPQAELLARVDRAMDKPGPAAPDGDSASGRVVNEPPRTDADRRDSVVTPRFVNDVAGWLAAHYIPSHHEGRGGRSTVTLVQVNARYSNSGTLRSVERDPLKSRASILNYVFTPGMLEVLYRMYAHPFMDELERAARQSRRVHPLSDAQVADMFSVYADKFRRLAVSLDAASGADLPALSASIRREAEHEARANDSFARAYMALSAARESGNRDEIAIQSRRMAESTRVAGMYAERQERARNDMAYAIRRNVEGHALSSSELLFLGEWLSRRNCSVESVRAAADVCRRMAEQMTQRADDILQHREAAAVQAPGTETPAPSAENTASAPAESAASAAVSSGASSAAASAGAASGTSSPTSVSAVPAAAKTEVSASPAATASSVTGGSDAGSGSASPAGKKATSPAKPAYPEVSGSLNREAPAPAAEKTDAPAPAAEETAAPAAPAAAPAEQSAAPAHARKAEAAPKGESAPSASSAASSVPAAAAPAKQAASEPSAPAASASAAERAPAEPAAEPAASSLPQQTAPAAEKTDAPAPAAEETAAPAASAAAPAEQSTAPAPARKAEAAPKSGSAPSASSAASSVPAAAAPAKQAASEPSAPAASASAAERAPAEPAAEPAASSLPQQTAPAAEKTDAPAPAAEETAAPAASAAAFAEQSTAPAPARKAETQAAR